MVGGKTTHKLRGDLFATQSLLFFVALFILTTIFTKTAVKKDGSSSPGTLAGIRVTKRVLPCPVELYHMNTFHVLRFRLERGSFSFVNEPPNSEVEQMLADAHTQWHETFDPRNKDVWTVIPDGQTFEHYFPGSMLEQAFESLQRDEREGLANVRCQALSAVGFRPIEIRVPTSDQDERINGVSRYRLTDGHIAGLTAADLGDDIRHVSELLAVCPDGIDKVMQRSRLLYVHGYHEWEFFTISVHYAVLAVEASLRALYDKWLGTEEVEVSAFVEGTTLTTTLAGPRENILKWVKQRQAISVMAKGVPLPRNKSHLLDHAVRIGVLSSWERERCTHLLWLRDIFSHPTGTFIEWISWARDQISESSLWINLMWARFTNTLPREFAWLDTTNGSST